MQYRASLDWNAVRDFLAVARSGSLNRAAATLGVNPTTVGRRIEALEATLGTRLFQRAQTGFALTDEGRDLIERAERIEAAAVAFERRADTGDHVQGRVRLATAENLANVVLIPALPDLRARHPDLTVEIATDIRTANLHRREADLALRVVRPTQGNVSIKRVGTMRYGLYGSADYIARRTERARNAVRSDHRSRFEADDLIAWSETYADLPAAQWIERTLDGRPPALVATSLYAQVVAVRHGIGLAVLPCFMAASEPMLQHIPSQADMMAQELWLAVHTDLTASGRVRAVSDFVERTVKANADLLAGADGASDR
ncbi:LysR family transcriptional regulator [uncultured Roseobacter sp.]|uniref:LysR family transcriptional regulator n=1 Tax=uncultured Roseobacter sp. TaxID=114847 RepID=UPI00260C0F3A|nr:LysR family transcriptional regulator [uncultured Roseobacter sp.]